MGLEDYGSNCLVFGGCRCEVCETPRQTASAGPSGENQVVEYVAPKITRPREIAKLDCDLVADTNTSAVAAPRVPPSPNRRSPRSPKGECDKETGKKLKTEFKRVDGLLWEDVLEEVIVDLRNKSAVDFDWFLGSRALQVVDEHFDDEDCPTIVRFLHETLDKLVVRFLDAETHNSDTKRSWRALSDKWKRLDKLLQQENATTEEGCDKQLGDKSSEIEKTNKQDDHEEDEDENLGLISLTLREAFSSAFRSIVSILLKCISLQKGPSKVELLDLALDPKTSRYHHQSYLYSNKKMNAAWTSGLANIGAPHLHEIVLKEFQENSGFCKLEVLLRNVSDAKVANKMLAVFVKNSASLADEHSRVERVIDATMQRVNEWDMELILKDVGGFNQLIEKVSSIASTEGFSSISDATFGVALRFLKSDKLRYRRFGLEQFGKVALTLTTKRKVSREEITTYLKRLGVYEDIFGERMDERVVSCSEALLRNSALDIELIDLMLANLNSRAVRKLFTTMYTFPVLSESLMVHILVQCTKAVLEQADLGAFKLLLTSLASDSYLRQSIVKKGETAMLASAGALWSLVFANSVFITATSTPGIVPLVPSTQSKAHGQKGDSKPSKVSVASSLGIDADQMEELLTAFCNITRDATDALRSRFADRTLQIVRGSYLSTNEVLPADCSSIGFFGVDDDADMAFDLDAPSAAQSRGSLEDPGFGDGGLSQEEGFQPSVFLPETVLVAYKLFNRLIEATPIEEQVEFISALDDSWGLKQLILDEFSHFVQHSEVRKAYDEMNEYYEDLQDRDQTSEKIGSFGGEMAFEGDLYGAEHQALTDHENARLYILSTLVETTNGVVQLTSDDMAQLWEVCCCPYYGCNTGTNTTQEAFMLWLRIISFEHLNSTVETDVTLFVLNKLFADHINLSSLGPKAYHALQAHFVFVNNSEGRLKATDSEAVSEEFTFSNQPPPSGLEGNSLVGRRILVQPEGGTIAKGRITKFISWSNAYQIEYADGTIDKNKNLRAFAKWWLLPPLAESMAGPPRVEEVKGANMVGMDAVWQVALYTTQEHVSAQAFHLLLEVYQMLSPTRKNEGEQGADSSDPFLVRIFHEIQECQQQQERLLGQRVDFVQRCLEFIRLYASKLETIIFRENDFSTPSNFPRKLIGIGRGKAIEETFMLLKKEDGPVSLGKQCFTKMRLEDLISLLSSVSGGQLDRKNILLKVMKTSGLDSPPADIVVSLETPGLFNLTIEDLGISATSTPNFIVSVRAGSKDEIESGKDETFSASTFSSHDLSVSCYSLSPFGRVSMDKQRVKTLFDIAAKLHGTAILHIVHLFETLPLFLSELKPLMLPPDHSDKIVVKWKKVLAPSISHGRSFWHVIYTVHILGSLVLLEDGNNGNGQARFGENSLVSKESFLLSGGPNAVLQFFTGLCKQSFENDLWVGMSCFPLIVGTVHCSVCALLNETPLDSEARQLLGSTARTLFQIILVAHEELEERLEPSDNEDEEKGVDRMQCNCASEELGERTLHQLSNTERSNYPPWISKELLRLKPPVCAFCLNTRRLVDAVLDALKTLELLMSRAGEGDLGSDLVLFVQETCPALLVRKLVLYCTIKELREEVCCMMKRLGSDSDGFRNSVSKALRTAEMELEEERLSVTCADFFELFESFVPDRAIGPTQLDFDLVSRVMFLLLDWPSRQPVEFNQADETRRKGSTETTLFVGFARSLTHILNSHPELREHVRQVDLDTGKYSSQNLITLTWDKLLMDATRGHPFCATPASRSAVDDLLCALAKGDPERTCELISLIESFSNSTPVPLREAVKGRKLIADWTFDAIPEGYFSSVFKGRNKTGHVGLRNRGSTCYINSLLQLFFHIPRFRDAIMLAPVSPPTAKTRKGTEDGEEETKVAVGWMCICSGINDFNSANCHICFSKKSANAELVTESFYTNANGTLSKSAEDDSPLYLEVLRQLQRTFRFLQDCDKGCYDPIPFVEACSTLKLQFPVTSQNDASEFYDKLLDNLEEGLKGTPFLKQMNECFLGQQTKLKRCHVCGLVSKSREESFFRLELMTKDNSVEKNSLDECLQSFVAPEVLTGDNKVDCDQCNRRSPCTFVSCLTELPDYLFIHPKRFTFDLTTMQTVKLNHEIQFPTNLDMFPFTRIGRGEEARMMAHVENSQGDHAMKTEDDATYRNSRFDAKSFFGSQHPSELEIAMHRQSCQYKLSGVLVHRGRAGGGHYYSFKNVGGGDVDDGKWFRFDDAKVSQFDPNSQTSGLASECFGGTFIRTATNSWGSTKREKSEREWSAFMLLYERTHMGSPDLGEDIDVLPLSSLTSSLTPSLTPSSVLAKRRRSIRKVRYQSMKEEGVRFKSPSVVFSGSVVSHGRPSSDRFKAARSLKETTLSGLIVSHRDWQSKRFNVLLNEEVRISNAAINRQSLLYDPIVSRMALELAVGALNCIKQNMVHYDMACGMCQSTVRAFQHIILRSNPKIQGDLSQWLNTIDEMFTHCPSIAKQVIEELVFDEPRFYQKMDQKVLMEHLDRSISQLSRLQQHSKALEEVGVPLLSARGLRTQILDCLHRPSFDASLHFIKSAVSTVLNSSEEPVELIKGLFKRVLEELHHVSTHTTLCEMYGQLWLTLVQVDSKVIVDVATELNSVACLIHLFLGLDSPGHQFDPEKVVLPDVGAADKVAVANFKPLMGAIYSLLSSPLQSVEYPELTLSMLESQELRSKLLGLFLAQPHNAPLVQDIIVVLCKSTHIEGKTIIVHAINKLREYAPVHTIDLKTDAPANKMVRLRRLIYLVVSVTEEDDEIARMLCEAGIEALKKSIIPATEEVPEDMHELAKLSAENVCANKVSSGTAQFVVNLMACVEKLCLHKEKFMLEWIPSHTSLWSPLASWLVLVSPPHNARGFITGFSPGYVETLLRAWQARLDLHAPPPPPAAESS